MYPPPTLSRLARADGGIYVPLLAARVQADAALHRMGVRLVGAAVGDGCIGFAVSGGCGVDALDVFVSVSAILLILVGVWAWLFVVRSKAYYQNLMSSTSTANFVTRHGLDLEVAGGYISQLLARDFGLGSTYNFGIYVREIAAQGIVDLIDVNMLGWIGLTAPAVVGRPCLPVFDTRSQGHQALVDEARRGRRDRAQHEDRHGVLLHLLHHVRRVLAETLDRLKEVSPPRVALGPFVRLSRFSRSRALIRPGVPPVSASGARARAHQRAAFERR